MELEQIDQVVRSVRKDENGEARLCDCDSGKHLFRVRDQRCNDIVVRRIFPDPSIKRTQTILLYHCTSFGNFVRSCLQYIRVRTTLDEPVPQANLQTGDGAAPFVGSSFGVLRLAVPAGVVLNARISADGFRPVAKILECDKADVVKMNVVLERTECRDYVLGFGAFVDDKRCSGSVIGKVESHFTWGLVMV